MRGLPAILLALLPLPALADVPAAPPAGWSEGWSTWQALPLVALFATHVAGARRQWVASRRGRATLLRRAAFFGAAWLALAVAVVSPLDAWAGLLFSVHMVQHLLLVLVAAPLLVLARPAAALLRGLPRFARRPAARLLRLAPFRLAVRPLPALAIHGGAVWIWHAPALYERALQRDLLHALEHGSFVLSGVVFFEAIRRAGLPGGMGHGAAVLFVFAAATQATILGALLTFAPEPLYATHAAGAVALGIHPLEDQQLAGLLMWVPGNAVYVVLALVLLRAFLLAAERRTLQRELATAALRHVGRKR
ncbi:cytochrome c oxidase assembly protein [Vulgatibacter sp.]|uniref:cytochrome c oxidase assembly protein n=1 Tax=Vulgatibacter sp. TaxID=1971226 RepID=UPI003566BE9D